jgi:hypothetical protein
MDKLRIPACVTMVWRAKMMVSRLGEEGLRVRMGLRCV